MHRNDSRLASRHARPCHCGDNSREMSTTDPHHSGDARDSALGQIGKIRMRCRPESRVTRAPFSRAIRAPRMARSTASPSALRFHARPHVPRRDLRPAGASLEVLGLKAGLSRDFRKDGRTKFLGIMEREWIVRPPVLFQDLVGAHGTVMTPPNPLQSGEHTTRLRRRPRTHAAMSNMAFAESGGSSPWAIRSRTISRAAD